MIQLYVRCEVYRMTHKFNINTWLSQTDNPDFLNFFLDDINYNNHVFLIIYFYYNVK